MADDIIEEEPLLTGEPHLDIPPAPEAGEDTDADDSVGSEEASEESRQPTVPDAFVRDLKTFGETIRKNPAIVDQIRDVLEYHLVDQTDRRMFSRIVNAMTMVLGHSSTMVVATACHINAAPFFEDILKHTGDDEDKRTAVSVLQHLTALYGNRVQEAYALSVGTLDEDWFTADINTYRREGEQYWMIDLFLSQYNGKTAHLKMTPESLFQLTMILVSEARKLPADALDPNLIARYADEVAAFENRFSMKRDDGAPPGYA